MYYQVDCVHRAFSGMITNCRTVCENKHDVVFQLAGTAVFTIGLWLRLDPQTKGLFEETDSPNVFYTGKIPSVLELEHYPLSFKQSYILDYVSAAKYACICL